MPEKPELTIAIATRDRPQLLTDVLRSCGGQRLDDRFFEILVVADGDSEGTSAACESFARELAGIRKSLSFRVIEPWQEGRGLAAARNVCASEAQGRYIRFQDDDDVLDPYAADAMLNAHFDSGPGVAVLGHTAIATELLELPIMDYLAHEGGELFNYRAVPTGPLDFDWFWGGRVSLATSIVRSIGFDENLRFGAEDIEFAFRAKQQAGLKVSYVPGVRSVMIRAVDLPSFANRCYRQGRSARYAARKHPRSRLEDWAVMSHAYATWTGDGGRAFSRAFERCRKLELALDYRGQVGVRSDELRRIVGASYQETFGLARGLGFAEIHIAI